MGPEGDDYDGTPEEFEFSKELDFKPNGDPDLIYANHVMLYANTQAHAVEPSSYKKALESPDKDKWIDAMQEEFQSLEEMGTWKMVDIPKGRKIVGCKWVFKAKIGVYGEVRLTPPSHA